MTDGTVGVRVSNLFTPVETIGLVTDGLPISFYKLGTESFFVTSLGRSYYVMNLEKLRVILRSGILPGVITAIHGSKENVYVALDESHTIHMYYRITQTGTLTGHQYSIIGLFTLGNYLISWSKYEVIIWDLEKGKIHGQLPISTNEINREISHVIHPETYINKIIVSYRNSTDVELWNLKTLKYIHSFLSVNPEIRENKGITAMCLSVHPDVIGLGYATGEFKLLDIKKDQILGEFQHSIDQGAVVSLACRTDQSNGVSRGIFISGCENGDLVSWDVKELKILHVTELAHTGEAGVTSLVSVPGEPLVISSGDDNSIIVWIFDVAGDIPRELRSRKGLQAPINHLQFYDDEGKELLCLGDTDKLCSFGRIGTFQQHQNCQFSYRKILKDITQKWRSRLQKLPPSTSFGFAFSRHYDWPNIATTHKGMSTVFLWSGHDKRMVSRTIDLPYTPKSHFKTVQTTGPPVATALAISGCGSYIVVGYENGSLHKFNLQSGLYRGPFKRASQHGHDGPVTRIQIINSSTVLSSSNSIHDCILRKWDLHSQTFLGEMNISKELNISELYCSIRQFKTMGVLTAVVLSTNDTLNDKDIIQSRSEKLILIDLDMYSIVRHFPAIMNDSISTINFSQDTRWIAFSTVLKPYLYVYDIISSALIDWIELPSPALTFSFDPSNAFLYLSQVHLKGGVSVLANTHIFDPNVSAPLLKPAPEHPILIGGPCEKIFEKIPDNDIDTTFNNLTDISIKPLEPGRLTLSGESEGRLQAILNLEQIKARNKPRDSSVKTNADAPFFLPTVYDGKETKFIHYDTQNDNHFLNHHESDLNDAENTTHHNKGKKNQWNTQSDLQQLLYSYKHHQLNKDLFLTSTLNDVHPITAYLKSLSPSGIHLALSELGSIAGGQNEELTILIDYFVQSVYSREDADFIQVLLQVFLQHHGETLADMISTETQKQTTTVDWSPNINNLIHESDEENNENNTTNKTSVHLRHSLEEKVAKLRDLIRADWEPIELQCHQAACFLKFLTHTQIE